MVLSKHLLWLVPEGPLPEGEVRRTPKGYYVARLGVVNGEAHFGLKGPWNELVCPWTTEAAMLHILSGVTATMQKSSFRETATYKLSMKSITVLGPHREASVVALHAPTLL